MSVRKVVATLVGLQALYAGFGVAANYLQVAEPVVFTLWAIVGIFQLLLIRVIARLYRQIRRPQIA